jgi:hypothetical protein
MDVSSFSWISRFRESAVVEVETDGGAELDGAEESDEAGALVNQCLR